VVDGVQVRLRAEKLAWKVDEVIQLLLDLHNVSNHKDDIIFAIIEQQCEVEYDGQWFEWTGSHYTEILSFPLSPDTKRLNAMQILIPKSWTSIAAANPLKLTPGKHTIRVKFQPMGLRIYKSDPEPSPAISNSLQMEIIDPAKSTSEIGNGYGSMATPKENPAVQIEQRIEGIKSESTAWITFLPDMREALLFRHALYSPLLSSFEWRVSQYSGIQRN
jgi:hypothetical protein